MPLSEHEQRLLEQIERGLYEEDPQFASKVRKVHSATPRKQAARTIVRSVVVMLAGLAMIVLAVSVDAAPLGALGFAVMLGGGYLAIRGSRSGSAPTQQPSAPKPASPKSSLSGRMEDRWRRRWEDRGL